MSDNTTPLISYKNYCTCGGYAHTLNERDPKRPHAIWCKQREEYNKWYDNFHGKINTHENNLGDTMTNFETIAQTYVDNIVKYLSAQPFEMPAEVGALNLRILRRLSDAELRIQINDKRTYDLVRGAGDEFQIVAEIVPSEDVRGVSDLTQKQRLHITRLYLQIDDIRKGVLNEITDTSLREEVDRLLTNARNLAKKAVS